MLSEEDDFKLDDLNQSLSALASQFISARQDLFKLPLNSEEKEILEYQRQLTIRNAPL